jgi:ketosteroid isomerase-like protein
MSEENVQLTRRAFEALGEDGPEGLIPYLDPDIEWISIPGFLPDAVDHVGRAGVRRWFMSLSELFDEISWRLDEVVDSQERVMVSCTARARGRSSGIEVEVQIFMSASIGDGRVTRLESFLSRGQALEAAGLSD